MMLKIINRRFAKRVRAGVTAGEGSSEPGQSDIRGQIRQIFGEPVLIFTHNVTLVYDQPEVRGEEISFCH